jgi:uncharacterized protein (TIGR01244 family)
MMPGIEEAAAIQHLGDEARGVEAAERGLGVGAVGKAERADLAVAPGLGEEPAHRVFAVLAIRQVFHEGPVAAEAAAGLEYRYLPVAGGYQSPEEAAEMARLLSELPRPVLMFCRSGARSARLFALAQQT